MTYDHLRAILPARKPLPSIEVIEAKYFVRAGRLYYTERPTRCDSLTVKQRADNILFNQVDGGRVAPVSWCDQYLSAHIGDDRFFVHRIVWKLAYNDEPLMIDHIDGDTRNNRIENLRAATATENNQNRAIAADHKHGYFGVRENLSGTWSASIGVNGKSIGLGTYETKGLAVGARQFAERHYGFHPNHGRQPVQFKYNHKRDQSSPYVIAKHKRSGHRQRQKTYARHPFWPPIGPERPTAK